MMTLSSRLKSRKKNGFTLIELLVVIAIIALLLSILMPALSKVKAQARNLVCATNIKSLFTAYALYSGDNNDKLVQPYTYNGSAAANDPRSQKSAWSWLPWNATSNTVVLTNSTIEQRHEGIRRGSLFTYSDNVKVYACRNKIENNNHFRNYSIPDFLNGEWGVLGIDNAKVDTYTTYKKIGAIKRPSNKFVFIEENDWRDSLRDSFVLMGGSVSMGSTTNWGDPITTRHSGASSFVFADGHTEFKKWSKDTVDVMAIPTNLAPAEDADGNPSATAEADIQWVLDHWTK